MSEERLRFAPAWTDDNWFSKTRGEKLSLLGIKREGESKRLTDVSCVISSDIGSNQSKASSESSTVQDVVKPTSEVHTATQDSKDLPDRGTDDLELPCVIANQNKGDVKADAKPSSRWAQLAVNLLNEEYSERDDSGVSIERSEITEVASPGSKWCQLANQLLDSRSKVSQDDPVEHHFHQPHGKQQSRKRWTHASDFYYDVVQVEDEDILEPHLIQGFKDKSADVHPKLDKVFTSGDFFHRIYGSKFEIEKEFNKICPPIIPRHLIKSEPLIQNGVVSFVLGRGSYGQVIKAKLTDGKDYEKKIVVKEMFNHKFYRDMIFEEAKTLLYLERTGYVPVCLGVVSHGGQDDVYGILQECVGEGLTLEKYLWGGRGRLVPICLIHIAKQLADGLIVIHNMGILINDIKVDNVLLDMKHGVPAVKYCDFGLATYKVGKLYLRTARDHLYSYLAPEVRYGGTSCFKSDVYSLGHMFTVLARYGQFDALVDVSTKCLLSDIEERASSEALSRDMSEIYNNNLQVKILPDGRLVTNLDMAACQLGDTDNRNNVVQALDRNGNVPGLMCPTLKSQKTVSVKHAIVHVSLGSTEEADSPSKETTAPTKRDPFVESDSSQSSFSIPSSVDASSDGFSSNLSSIVSDDQSSLLSTCSAACIQRAHNSDACTYDADDELSVDVNSGVLTHVISTTATEDIGSCNSANALTTIIVTEMVNSDDTVCDHIPDVPAFRQKADATGSQQHTYKDSQMHCQFLAPELSFHHSQCRRDVLIRPDHISIKTGVHHNGQNMWCYPLGLHEIDDAPENNEMEMFQFLVLFMLFIVVLLQFVVIF